MQSRKSLSVVSSLLYSGYSDNNTNEKKKKMAAGTSSFRKTAQATSHQQQKQKQKHQKNDISRTQLLNDGNVIPTLGLGTWKSNPPEECTLAITSALRNGLTHLDCASAYANEHVIGKCLSKVFGDEDTSREDVFITSKLWNDRRKPDDVREALEQTLEDFKAPVKKPNATELERILTRPKPSQTRREPLKKKPNTKVVKSKEDLEEDFKVIEIPIIMKEFEEWIKNNPGKEFREFLKEQEYIRKQDEQKFKDIVLAGALGKIDDAMSGIMSMAMGGIIRDPSYTYYSDGGSANKPKDPATKIKKLNLADYFQYGMKIADLTESEREVVNDLLKKSFGKNYSDK